MRRGFFSFLNFTTTDGKSGLHSKHFIKFFCYAKCRLHQFDFKEKYHGGILHNGSGLCVVALSRNLKLTTTLNGAITQNPCYVSVKFTAYETRN